MTNDNNQQFQELCDDLQGVKDYIYITMKKLHGAYCSKNEPEKLFNADQLEVELRRRIEVQANMIQVALGYINMGQYELAAKVLAGGCGAEKA